MVTSSSSCQMPVTPQVGWNSCPPALTILGLLSVLSVYRSCVHSHSWCEFVCASALLCLGNTVSFKLFIIPGSYRLPPSSFGKTPSPEKSMEHTQSLVMGVCVNCLLLQEVPLTRVELYGYSSVSLGAISMLCPVSRVIVGVLL